MGFIKKDGAPIDEYSLEAAEIARKIKPNMDNKELAELVHSIFTDFMGIDPVGFEKECLDRSHEMRTLLSKR